MRMLKSCDKVVEYTANQAKIRPKNGFSVMSHS